MEHNIYFKAEYHYENIPKCLQVFVSKKFMKHYNEVVDVFNNFIEEVNSEWEATGEVFAFGDYEEDINPNYIKAIKKHIQPNIDVINKRFYICKYKLGKYSEIVGYVPFLKNSEIWITLKPWNEAE